MKTLPPNLLPGIEGVTARIEHRLWTLMMGVLLALGMSGLESRLHAQFAITEFMADNQTSLKDEDGKHSDWIEIHNESAAASSLAGWFLTDTTNNLTKWQFPATNLPSGGYLVVFASGQDRRTPGAPLHTNFKLSSGGEYLALVQPDGTNIVSQFAPVFPPQVADVSYGIVRDTASVTLLSPGAPVRAFVPPTDSLGLTWTAVEFDDSGWTNGATGVGYDRQPIGVNYLPLIGLNVESMMYPNYATIYARVPFTVTAPGNLSGLTLRIKFEDGFIAYLNGQEIARSNAPANATFNSIALAPRTDTSATNFVDFDLSEFRGFLIAGANVLAFQALNNPTNSPDLLLVPQLDGLTPDGPPITRYFPAPTPGSANNDGVATLGPLISEAQHTPAQPADADNITVTARLRAAFAPVATATLRYRVMFGSEVSVPMFDDGAHGDGAAGDGVYGASIPASASMPGQMVRYYITATDTTATNTSRFPPFTDTNNSPAYLGTIIANPALTNALPVFHWFVENVAAADTTAGTRCSVYWNGQFYDNVLCRLRGATAATYPKKPYKFNFNPGYHFAWLPGQPRENQINLNTTYQDKAYIRAPLTFETYRNGGAPACDAFTVRVQQNGLFYSVAVQVEEVDETFLQRRGLDPNGALYKMYNGDSSTGGALKKTRLNEDNSDLQQLFTGLSPGNPNRATFVFDNFDMPALINYLAAGTIAQDLDRTVKNHYLYRDTEGTRLWTVLPWDKDLTFGLFGLQCTNVAGNDDSALYTGQGGGYISHPLFGKQGLTYPNGANNTFDVIYTTPATLQMYLRRLRTLMDELLQPPATPIPQLAYEHRLDELALLLQPDATLDLAKWGGTTFGQAQTLATAMGLIKTNYFAERRVHLYQTHGIDNIGAYPAAAGIPHAQTGSPALQFGAIEFNPASSNQAEEYIEIINPYSVAVDISQWQLAGGVGFTFAPGTVVPSNGRIYVSPDTTAFRARTSGPRGGQGLLVVGPYQGQLSARGETLRLSDEWGRPVASSTYFGQPGSAQQFLRITEVMYHPAPLAGNTNSAEEFEYVEFKNISTNLALDLTGVRFTTGIDFTFTGSVLNNLGPGQTVLIVKNLAAFTARYGLLPNVAGQYLGALNNGGDRLQVVDASGEEILDFTYDNNWYPITDGLGFSLVVVDEHAEPDAWNLQSNWRPSGRVDGSPGVIDPPPLVLAPILINEALSRTDVPPPTDSIELYNPAAVAMDLGGWFLTDDFNVPKKFRFPNRMTLGAGGYLVIDETQFNPNPGVPPSFSLHAEGDSVFLFSGDSATNLTGYVHGFKFGAAEDGVSFGRYVTSMGEEHFVSQVASSLGAANVGPKVGPVVISEVMYRPPDLGTNDDTVNEFIELVNITTNTVPLFDPTLPTNTWKLAGGVSLVFPTNQALAPQQVLLVVNFDPATNAPALAAFRAEYGLVPALQVFGPYGGKLNNSGDTIELLKPALQKSGAVSDVLVDRVTYRNSDPWPAGADGFGLSLQRLSVTQYGNDPANWVAAPPTVGVLLTGNGTSPIITQQPMDQRSLTGTDITLQVAASGTGPLAFQWRFNGANITGATNANLLLGELQPDQAGVYGVAVFNSAGSVVSANAMVAVVDPVTILAQPQNQTARLPSLANPVLTNVTFSVAALGSPPINYQWSFNGINVAGATNNAYTVSNLSLASQGAYRVLVSDADGSILSDPATLNILVAPMIVQPLPSQPITVLQGGSMTYTVAISGYPPPFNYQWRRGSAIFTNISLTNMTCSLTLSNLQPSNSGLYRVVITNLATLANSVPTTSTNTLIVLSDTDGDGLPDFWETLYGLNPNNPADATADTDGDGLTNLQEYIAGTNPTNALSYLKVDRINSGLGPTALQFLAVSNKSYSMQYKESFTVGRWTTFANPPARPSNHVETVQDPYPATAMRLYRLATPQLPASVNDPAILTSPQPVRAAIGDDVNFNVFAVGAGPLSYQWLFNGTNLDGQTSSNLLRASMHLSDAGAYAVIVSDQNGSQTTDTAVLAFRPMITVQPQSQSAEAGSTVILGVQAIGPGSLGYRWRHNRKPISGQTNSLLTLTNVGVADAGNYSAIVTVQTPLGLLGATSSNATLTVLTP